MDQHSGKLLPRVDLSAREEVGHQVSDAYGPSLAAGPAVPRGQVCPSGMRPTNEDSLHFANMAIFLCHPGIPATSQRTPGRVYFNCLGTMYRGLEASRDVLDDGSLYDVR